jgi:cell division protein FtsZ
MTFEVKEPVLVIGLGGAGIKLASEIREALDADSLKISQDKKDISEHNSIHISTKSIINPSVQLIRGCAMEQSEKIAEHVSTYETVIIMANLAGKSGAALAPVVSSICKEQNKNLLSFAIMPFKFEKDRIFQSGISLKRLRMNSDSTIIIDNDAVLDSNPDLTAEKCYDVTNNAIKCLATSIKSSSLTDDTNIMSTSRNAENMEDSVKDSIRMLYEDAPPNSIKRSMLYIYGASKIPVGVINSISNILGGVFDENNSQINMTTSENTNMVLLSAIAGETRFDKYDPLGIISKDKILDWDEPETSFNCELDLQQIE